LINKTMIRERLCLIKEHIERLEHLAQTPPLEFKESYRCAAAESFLRRSFEAIFDIGRHIVAKRGSIELAREYKSIAKGLQKLKVVDQSLGQKLIKMAGYRNRLVHFYNLVTEDELYEIINHELKDIRSFAQAVRDFLEQ
jgi:uncharacterized protein YutE (UPF0331/DUF86 family)